MTNCGAEISDLIVAVVPIGESKAATQREIGKMYGIGAPSSIGIKLRQAVENGSIKRREEMRPFGFARVYWREAP